MTASRWANPRSLTWHEDGGFSGYLFSYCLGLNDGGRRHHFEAPTLAGAIAEIEQLTRVAQRENEATKKELAMDHAGCDRPGWCEACEALSREASVSGADRRSS